VTLIARVLTFNYQICQSQPAPQVLTVATEGSSLPFTASAISSNCNNLLNLSPSSGRLWTERRSNHGIGILRWTPSAHYLQRNDHNRTAGHTCRAVDTGHSQRGEPGRYDLGAATIVQTSNGSNASVNVPIALTASDNTTRSVSLPLHGCLWSKLAVGDAAIRRNTSQCRCTA
jgi:hypothetical protein